MIGMWWGDLMTSLREHIVRTARGLQKETYVLRDRLRRRTCRGMRPRRPRRLQMMLALVLIVATDTAPTPVSAVPRSLSEYALRHPGLIRDAKTEPGKGAGGFSAAESTIPREPYV